MKDPFARVIIIAAITFLLVSLPTVYAEDNSIRVETEGFGDIVKGTNQTNTNGAMVWNGQEWVVNPTWAHKFFVNNATGERLKSYSAIDVTVSGLPTGETATHADGYGAYYQTDSFDKYTITKQAYWYTKTYAPGKGDGSYQYGTVEYRILDTITDKTIILRSRDVSADITKAYFDVYTEDDTTAGIEATTTALIGDPLWYTFKMDAESALDVSNLSEYQTGSLPGAVTENANNIGDYYLDVNGGADLGGKSYELHTQPLTSLYADLSPSYVTSYELKFMDDTGNLKKIVASPTIFSLDNTSTAPEPTNNLSNSPEAFPTWVILVVVVAVVIVVCLFLVFKKKTQVVEQPVL